MAETLYEIMSSIGHRLTRHDGQFGIEIETETNSPYRDPPLRNWNIIPDGSLRNYGREYVLAAPMSFGKGLEEALAEFAEGTKGIPFNQGSNSTSVHIHVNMLNETVRTLFNAITAYSLMEPLLISACGEERRSNLFCLPFHDTGGTVHEVQALMSSIEGNFTRQVRNLNSELLKYSGLNISTLRTIGSIECRTMEGTTDVSRIEGWIRNFEKIVEFSRNPELNPVEVLSSYLTNKEGFLKSLGIDEAQFNGDIQELLKKGQSTAFDLAVTFYDWEKAFKTFDAATKKSSKKKAEDLSASLDGVVRRARTRADTSVDVGQAAVNPFQITPEMAAIIQREQQEMMARAAATPVRIPPQSRRGRTVVAEDPQPIPTGIPASDEFVELVFEEEA